MSPLVPALVLLVAVPTAQFVWYVRRVRRVSRNLDAFSRRLDRLANRLSERRECQS